MGPRTRREPRGAVPRAPVANAQTPRSHEVRLIGGHWKRSKLAVPDRPGLRPTPDRVRETLFNWLGQDLTGWHCMDAFAGSGALGFEAASRGAAHVVLVEQDRAVAKALLGVALRLGAVRLEVVCGDGVSALRRCAPASLDLVFLDPPYGSGLLASAVAAAHSAVRPGGLLYVEDAHQMAAPEGWHLYREGAAGQVHFHLMRKHSAGSCT
jgi:16S rRNA (guanine966-N2)-methyltransferase